MSIENKHLSINSLSYHSTEENEEENSCKNSLFFGLFEDSESISLRSGSMKRQYSDMGDLYNKVHQEYHYNDNEDGDGSKMDMRVLMVLEYMRELYVGQLELLEKMFPGGAKDKFLGFFNKIGDAMSRFKHDSRVPTKSMTMRRSFSDLSPRFTLRGVNMGKHDLKDERFKVTTVDAGNAPPGGGAGASGGGASGGAGASGSAGGGKGGQGPTKK